MSGFANAAPWGSRNSRFPSAQDVEAELDRVKAQRRNVWTGLVVAALVLVAFALSVLISTYLLPVVRVYGSSMTPTLREGDVVVTVRDAHPEPGDLIAFYYGNDVLVKRVIAGPGSWVDILADGTVSVNAVPLQEPYLVQKDAGTSTVALPFQVPEDSYGPGSWVDILADGTVSVNAVPLQEPYLVQKDAGTSTVALPFQVPEDSYFVLGDNRGTSVDSRSAQVGAVESSQIIGRLGLRVWPLDRLGFLG